MKQSIDNIILGLDMDGVLFDFSSVKQKVAKEFGFSIALEETPSDIVRGIIPEPILEEIKKSLFVNGPHKLSIPLMAGAPEGLRYFSEKGVPLFLISRRKRPDVAQTLLKTHGLWPRHFNEKNSFFVREREEKDSIARSLGITHFVDDEPSVIMALHSVPNKILFDQFSVYKDGGAYVRCASWNEVKRLFF